MRAIRAKRKLALMDDPVRKVKRCTKCQKLKPYSAFSCRSNAKAETPELNKICDECLIKSYTLMRGTGDMTDPAWWRAKAYNVNTTHRQKLAQVKSIPIDDVRTSDLAWVCKPTHLLELYENQQHKCYYCGVELSKNNLSVDHKIPRAKGGSASLDNLALCCSDCNFLKHTRTEQEFLVFINEYTTRFINRIKDKEP